MVTRHTTIRLNPALTLEAKNYAQKQGVSFTELVEIALKKILKAPFKKPSKPKSFKLHRFKGKGLQAGVNLDSYSSLLDKMENLDEAPRR